MKISDRNKQRKLRYGQATLLGVQFEQRWCAQGRNSMAWFFRHTSGLRDWQGWSNPFGTRWEAVNTALYQLGLLK